MNKKLNLTKKQLQKIAIEQDLELETVKEAYEDALFWLDNISNSPIYRYIQVDNPDNFVKYFDKEKDYAGGYWTLEHTAVIDMPNAHQLNVLFTGYTSRDNVDLYSTVVQTLLYPDEVEVVLKDSTKVNVAFVEKIQE
jgi:hypothetical protein